MGLGDELGGGFDIFESDRYFVGSRFRRNECKRVHFSVDFAGWRRLRDSGLDRSPGLDANHHQRRLYLERRLYGYRCRSLPLPVLSRGAEIKGVGEDFFSFSSRERPSKGEAVTAQAEEAGIRVARGFSRRE